MQRDPLNSEGYFGSLDSYLANRNRQLVKPLLVSDLAWQAMRDLEAEKDGGTTSGIGKRWRSIRTDGIPDAEFMGYANTPVILRNYGHYGDNAIRLPAISVNLSASDGLLLKAFSDWLKEARSSQQCDIQKPRKPLYDRWASYGLLPYLDLLIWSKETDTRIPYHVMSDAVGYVKGESSFSKTVIPLASSLIRDLSTLEALAVAEAQASPEAETFSG